MQTSEVQLLPYVHSFVYHYFKLIFRHFCFICEQVFQPPTTMPKYLSFLSAPQCGSCDMYTTEDQTRMSPRSQLSIRWRNPDKRMAASSCWFNLRPDSHFFIPTNVQKKHIGDSLCESSYTSETVTCLFLGSMEGRAEPTVWYNHSETVCLSSWLPLAPCRDDRWKGLQWNHTNSSRPAILTAKWSCLLAPIRPNCPHPSS